MLAVQYLDAELIVAPLAAAAAAQRVQMKYDQERLASEKLEKL